MKKVISLLISAILLVSCLGISVVAVEPTPAASYTVTGSYALANNVEVSPELFAVNVSVDSSKIAALDGESKEFTYTLDSLTANGVDYIENEEAFFDVFRADDYDGATLEATVTFNFESDKVFGTLNYTVSITGFLAPLAIGLGPVDDALSNVALPVDVTFSDNVWNFPKVDTITVDSKPTKQDYLDNEKFDFAGTSISVNTKVATSYEDLPDSTGALHRVYTYEPGYSGVVNYAPDNANMFTGNPSVNEKLNVNVSEVVAYFDGIEIVKLPISVDHAWSAGYSSITTGKYTEGNPGYHAIVCNGCGEAHDANPHSPSPVFDENGEILLDKNGEEVYWTYNNDQTFMNNGTESSICSDCGAVLTRDTFGTADYNTELGNYHFIRVILDYINMLLNIINGTLG